MDKDSIVPITRVNIYPNIKHPERMRVDTTRMSDYWKIQSLLWGLRFTEKRIGGFWEGDFNYRSLLKINEAARDRLHDEYDLSVFPTIKDKYDKWIQRRNELLAIKRQQDINIADDYFKAKDLWEFQRVDAKFGLEAKRALLLESMGTGKTVISSAIVEMARKFRGVKKVLIICPSAVRTNWKVELLRWTTIPTYEKHFTNGFGEPDIKIDSHHILVADAMQSDRRMPLLIATQVSEAETYLIINWETIRLPWFREYLASSHFDMIIADEAHRARNIAKSSTAQAFQELDAEYKYALTGTAIVNYPEDLYALVHWLHPDQYPSWQYFSEDFVQRPKAALRRASAKTKAKMVEEKLDLELDYMMVRRNKEDVMKWLPKKRETNQYVSLYTDQRRMYNQMRDNLIAILEKNEADPQASKFVTANIKLAQIMRLKQIAISPALVVMKKEGNGIVTPEIAKLDNSPKLDFIEEWIEQNPDEKLVIFSQYADAIKLLEYRLLKNNPLYRNAQCGYAFATSERKSVWDKKYNDLKIIETAFQEDDRVKLFMGTLGTGGEGITLTAACNLIMIDQWWNAAKMNQGSDRIHRGGQTRPVLVQKLVAIDTIEESILQLIAQKQMQANEILDTHFLLKLLKADREKGEQAA